MNEETQTSQETTNNINNSDNIIDNNISSEEVVSNGQIVGSEVSSESSLTNSETISAIITEDVKLEEIQNKVDELDDTEIKIIEEQSSIVAGDFKVNVTTADEGKYKWGYKVKLNSLNFMAKIDVTSEKNISILSDDSLQIGNQMLSFADLVKAGYTIRIEKPALEINISADTTNTEITTEETTMLTENNSNNLINNNLSSEEIVSEEQAVGNETSEQQEIVAEQLVEQTISETPVEPTGITGNIIKSFSKTFYAFAGLTGRVVDDTTGFAIEQTEIADVEYENTITIYIEKDFNLVAETITTNTETQTTQETFDNIITDNNTNNIIDEGSSLENNSSVGEVNAGSGISNSITGNVIADETTEITTEITTANTETTSNNSNINNIDGVSGEGIVSDTTSSLSLIKYEDIDGDGKISVGDIIELDPTLTYIYISKAEHLDSNRNYISDIYEQVKEQDGNWSEVIGNNEFVRVSFEKNLTNLNDITFYGRGADNCTINLSGSIIINGESVPCEIYNKKKRIDEIKKILFTNFLSLQFMILMFIPKKLKMRRLLG